MTGPGPRNEALAPFAPLIGRWQVSAVEGKTIRWSRSAPSLSQRHVWTIADDGRTFAGKGEMSRDGGPWEGDLEVACTRI